MTGGVVWHGPLPPGWNSAPLKAMARARSGGTPNSSNEAFWCDPEDGLPWVAIADMSGRDAVRKTAKGLTRAGREDKHLSASPAGTLLFAMYASVGEVARLAISATWNQAILGLTPCPGRAIPRYLQYALLAIRPHLTLDFRSNTQNNLNAWQVAHLRIPCPSLGVQRTIADFLDRETTQIDAMIGAQEDLILRISEYNTARRANVVLPLLGHGDRLRVHLTESDQRANHWAESLPLLSVSIDWGVRRRDESSINQAASEDLSNYKVVRQGDIVLNRMRAFQGALGMAGEDGIVSPDYAVFRAQSFVDPEWLVSVMRSAPFIGEMASRIRGIGSANSGQVRTPRLNARDFLDIRLTLPTQVEQNEMVARWRQREADIGAVLDAASEVVRLLRERREALITAAVTGRIDAGTGLERVVPTTEMESS